MRILSNFDRVVAENLKEKVKSKLTFKGHLHTYRFCDDVWTFVIKDVNVKLDNNDTINAEKIKIVACSALTNDDHNNKRNQPNKCMIIGIEIVKIGNDTFLPVFEILRKFNSGDVKEIFQWFECCKFMMNVRIVLLDLF
ncbi:hypothetical protein WICPIJ_006194 [Wickerhamomyces pijperi]|uniref:Transcription initiation factor IIA gamma subunit C-terminal domain-containing protein n=1 Tax=Wickerhamomyces pijperi TaxID=599730 RepID=A0A9P8Q4H9_WICPI|nr:hypothetical protein WICPIJ_006194 [Wickerhamomyces pijperi]